MTKATFRFIGFAVSYFLDFALLIASLTYSSMPHKTAVGILSDPLQNGSFVSPLSDELRVIRCAIRSTRSVFTMQIGELSTAIISLLSQRRISKEVRLTPATPKVSNALATSQKPKLL